MGEVPAKVGDAAEFAPIRGDLVRLYVRHKADLKLDDWSDEQVVAEVNQNTSALMACGGHRRATRR